MKLHTLKPALKSSKTKKRLGRGQGSGGGGTASRGHKGAKSRSGYSQKTGFEGGQMPLQRRIPKFGFKNVNRKEYLPINVDLLQDLSNTHNIDTFTPEVLVAHGFAKSKDSIKILCKGELTAKINVTAHAFSASAKEKIEAIGGTITLL
jgi:large subunit ribosomal protein L15